MPWRNRPRAESRDLQDGAVAEVEERRAGPKGCVLPAQRRIRIRRSLRHFPHRAVF